MPTQADGVRTPQKAEIQRKTPRKQPRSISFFTSAWLLSKLRPELVECHWRYFFPNYSKSTCVGLGVMAWNGTLLAVSIGITGNSVPGSRPSVVTCLGVYLGGENWTDTLLFRFNLHHPPIFTGLRPTVTGCVPFLVPLRLIVAKCLTSIVRHMRLSRSMRAVVAMSVESNRPAFRPDVSNHLTFPFRSTLRIS